jgi:hypothetical protein
VTVLADLRAFAAVDALTWRRRLMLVMVFVLPLHTVFLSQWISWKPFLIVLLAIAVFDLVAGWAARRWPWHVPATIALGLFLILVSASWTDAGYPGRFSRLLLALGVGGVVMLVVERGLREPNSTGPVLRTVFWSAAALGASAIVFAIVGVGALGSGAIDAFNDIPGVFRIFKPAYLTEGFVAVTNWHQDPGYSAAWMNLWAALALVAAIRRFGSGRWWADGAVIGALGLGTFMTMSRTGWVGFAAGLVAAAAILAIKDRVALRPLAERLIAGALVFVVLLGIVAVVDRPDIGSDLDQAVAFRLDQRLTLDAGDAGELGGSEGVVDARSVVWPQYVDAFLDNPLRGIGLGTGWATPDMQEPHNLALELLGETGLLGLAGFIVLFGVVVYFGRGTVGAIALTVALIAAFTQTVLFEPTWWFAAGLYLGWAGVDRTRMVAQESAISSRLIS